MDFILLFLAIIFQITIIPYFFKFFGVLPNLVLLVILFNLWQRNNERSYFISPKRTDYLAEDYSLILCYTVFGGLVLDLFSGLPFGIISLSLTFTFLLIYILFKGLLNVRDLYLWLVLVLLSNIFYDFFIFIFLYLFNLFSLANYQIKLFNFLWYMGFKELLINIILALIFYGFRRSAKILY